MLIILFQQPHMPPLCQMGKSFEKRKKSVKIRCWRIALQHFLCYFMPTAFLCFGSSQHLALMGSIVQWLCMNITSFRMFKRQVTQSLFHSTKLNLSTTTNAWKKTSTCFMVGFGHNINTRWFGWDRFRKRWQCHFRI